jgi:hypothetical protein
MLPALAVLSLNVSFSRVSLRVLVQIVRLIILHLDALSILVRDTPLNSLEAFAY